MRRPLVVPRSPPPAVTSRRMLMGLIGSGMCLSDVTCPQPPAEHPVSRITRTAVLLSLVRAPALPPRHAYFGSQSHTPYDRCLRFGTRVAATPARLAPVPLAQLWTDQTCTGKLIPASPIAPRTGLLSEVKVIDVRGLGGPFRFDPRIGASCDTPKPALCPGRASASTASSDWVPSLRPLRHRSARLCSRVSPVLWTHPTPRLFPDSFAVSASCRGPGSLLRLRARRGLPGSGASPSCVMWPQTPAGRRGLA